MSTTLLPPTTDGGAPQPPGLDPRGPAEPKPRRRWVGYGVIGVACLLVGGGIGVAASRDETTKKQLRETRHALSSTREDLTFRNHALSGARSANATLKQDLRHTRSQLREATAEGKVPDVKGQDVSDARAQLGDLPFDWRVKTVQQGSDAAIGTVLAQKPAPSAELGHGQAITLTVAKPLPKQWQTIVSLSGAGEKRTDEFTIPSGLKARLVYSFSGESNDIIEMKRPSQGPNDFGDLLYNEIGAKQGDTRVYASSGRHYLDVEGDSWTVQVQVFK